MKFSNLENGYDCHLLMSQDSSLMQWYRAVRDIDISEFEIGDLCKAVRQKIYIYEIFPFCISALEMDVLVGDDYDGQLLSSLTSLNKDDWRKFPKEAKEIKKILLSCLEKKKFPNNIISDAREILYLLDN